MSSNKKIRVMHIMPSNRFFGAENVICQIINLFKKNDEVEMILVCPSGPIRKQLDKLNINYIFLVDCKI